MSKNYLGVAVRDYQWVVVILGVMAMVVAGGIIKGALLTGFLAALGTGVVFIAIFFGLIYGIFYGLFRGLRIKR